MHLILCLALLLISPFEAADKKSKKKVNKPPPPDDLVIQSLSEDSEGCEPTTQEGNVLRVYTSVFIIVSLIIFTFFFTGTLYW